MKNYYLISIEIFISYLQPAVVCIEYIPVRDGTRLKITMAIKKHNNIIKLKLRIYKLKFKYIIYNYISND